MDPFLIHGIRIFQFKGSAEARAEAHGRVIGALTKEEQAGLAYTPLSQKNQTLIQKALKRFPGAASLVNSIYEAFVFLHYLGLPARYKKRLEPFVKAAGLKRKTVWLTLYQPDLLMALAAIATPKNRSRLLEGLPGCSTLRTGNRPFFLRNLDYPAAAHWENHQAVFYHEPEEEHFPGFVSVSSLGIPLAGLTGWNEHGIAFSLHAHFSSKASFRGVPIFFLGEEILESAKTLQEAIEICRDFKTMGSWALNLSSFQESKSVTVELAEGRMFVRESDDSGLIAHSNYFLSPAFNRHQLRFSGAFLEDSRSRKLTLEATAEKLLHHFDLNQALGVLGSHIDPTTGKPRVFGNVVSGITGIQSLAFDPIDQAIYVSIRKETPTGPGPFLKLPFHFDDLRTEAPPILGGAKETHSDSFLKARTLYHQAYVAYQVRNEGSGITLSHLRNAVSLLPEDPHLQMQRGYFELLGDHPNEAREAFQRALQEELSPHLRAVALYFEGASLDVIGNRQDALIAYHAISELSRKNPGRVDPELVKKANHRLKKRYLRAYCQRIEPDLQFAEPLNYL